ncbi:MAG TPA: BMP family ABC transporter substrate-binding protein [Nocardioidaceae bacterium]|nr:BMP family ABC transporter substrate-binding protein [Nocardioidaceae bacterium]
MKITARAAALVSVLALSATACGEAPSETESATSSENSDFKACMVTDSGGIDDRSFNQTSWQGVQQAVEEFGIESSVLESNSNADFVPNISQFVQQDCGIIVTVGFLLADATEQAAKDNPDQNFAIVDFLYDKPVDNIKPLVFNTAEAAFMAGYVSAGMTESGKVATFGGINIPTVTIFMDGYWQGVQHYNEQNGTDVQVLGWNQKSQNGSFTGDFTDQNKGKTLTENFIRQGADIVMPVAGPVGLGAAAAAQEADNVDIVWVDTDGCVSAQEYCDVFLTSVMKGMDVAVKQVIETTMNGEFDGEPYIGTLENGGVQLAPFHEHEDEVPDELKQQLDEVKQAIISGDIKITSPAQPGT